MRAPISPMGEAALLVELDGPPEAANRRALALARALEADPPAGLIDLVPAISSLLVCFDPLRADPAALEARLAGLLALPEAGPAAPPRLVEVPVTYGGQAGPDLAEVAGRLGLAPAELVALHTGAEQRVLMVGFAPGYPYLGGLPPALHLPRRSTPRTAVPAGSVAIAAGMTGIYPARLPGGWHLIGRTAMPLFDPAADPPAALAPGDAVRFVALPDGVTP